MTKQQKLVLVVAILAAAISFLDGTVVNVALPAIAKELGGGLATQQWVVNAYLITLGAFILLAGSLSDLFGRKKVLLAGLIGFGAASVLCAVAPNALVLILSRSIQGIAGALLVPSSLALIIGAFSGKAQAQAIGIWTSCTSAAMIVGPLLGGVLVDAGSWRWVFAINVPLIAGTLWLMRGLHHAEEIREHTKVDVLGAALCTAGLAMVVYALIEQPKYGWGSPTIFLPLIVGLAAFVGFIMHERRVSNPMLPLELFKVRNFTFGNLATTAIYAGLSVSTFLIVVFIQQIGHYSALQAGLALLPVTGFMILLSSRFGALAGKYGPRLFMTVGPIIAGLGFLSLLRVDASVSYVSELLPGILLFGLGLSMTVAPLTAAVLGDIEAKHAGIGSAINNAVARIAGLLATAAVGVVVGPHLTVNGFHKGAIFMALLLILGGVISFVGIRNHIDKEPIPAA
jgi:EmrB/QacA subfamily drug resistance transporter